MATYLSTPGGDAITIHNTKVQRTYRLLGPLGWSSSPIHPNALRPPPEMTSRNFRVLDELMRGLEVYEQRGPSGRITRLVPGLNGLVVFSREPGGATQELWNIQLHEPAPELFLPPPGVPVRESGPPVGLDSPGHQH
jgi:hypothetical protein